MAVALRPPRPGATHRVVSLVGSRLTPFELAVACEVFGIHRPEIEGWHYTHQVAARAPGPVDAGNGMAVVAEAGFEVVERAHTVVVPASATPPGAEERLVEDDVVEVVRAAHARGARIVSFCTGAFTLAAAGLLDGRRATTHWMHAAEMQRRFPRVRVDPDVLWVDDDPVFTSAGTAAAVDLCLHLVRADLGAEAANRVARRMVVPPHRDGGQAQFVDTPVPACPADDPLGPTLTWMAEHVDRPVTVEELARRAALSPRTFARRFVATTGTTPLQWLLAQRVARARVLLETTELAVERVAQECGFGTAAGLRAHFTRVVGTSPTAYRARFARDLAS